MATAKITYEGHNADLFVYDDKVVIVGKKFNKGMGEKSIPLASISAVQLVPSTRLVYGHIAFNVLGEVADSSNLYGTKIRAKQSENTVTVKKPADDEILKKVKAFVEQAKENATKSQATTIIQQAATPAEELKKMKELLDMGIITQAEFDAKKKQLLGL